MKDREIVTPSSSKAKAEFNNLTLTHQRHRRDTITMFKQFLRIIIAVALSFNLAISFTPISTYTARISRQLQLSQSKAEGDVDVNSCLHDFNCNNKQHTRRRAITTAIMSLTSTITSTAHAKVIGSGRCANGEGEGCDDLAEGNGEWP